MRTICLMASLLAVVSLAACSSSEDMALLHREITDVQRSVDTLQTEVIDQSDLRAMKTSMEDLTNQNLRSNADLAQRVVALQEQIEALHASLDLTTRRLQQISQELAAGRTMGAGGAVLPPVSAASTEEGGAGTAGAAAAGAAGAMAMSSRGAAGPEELYRSAYEDYMRGNYDLARDGFSEYHRRWPNTELSDNAVYWIGECYAAQEMPQEALDSFTKVLEDYPTSDKAAAAQLKKGLIYLKMGDQGQGVVNLQYVVYEHPGTREADLAREQLRSLGLTIR
jgi:tol-pal system protein YbgF